MKDHLFGVGLYSVSESALYTKVPAASINRWLYGYRANRQGRIIEKPPLWQPELDTGVHKTVSFRDLLEIRAIGLFLHANISWKTIHTARDKLIEAYGEKCPFSSGHIKTDGKYLYKDSAGNGLTDILSGQENMKPIIAQSLIDIDFDDAKPTRWWINGKEGQIVLDPNFSFGSPIEATSHVPTESLHSAVISAQGDMELAARYFRVDRDSVERAYQFERSLM